MKYYLYLDSSNTSLTVGLSTENEILEVVSYEAWQSQSEHMIPEINSLLDKYNVEIQSLEKVFVCVGPGSYTGVRISITIAKVIAAALNVKIYPISSLQVLKNNDKPSICLINARSGRSYIGVYEKEVCLLADQIYSNKEVIDYISSHPDYSVCGNVSYLGINGYQSNIVNEIFSIKDKLAPIENPLGLKPVYLKD